MLLRSMYRTSTICDMPRLHSVGDQDRRIPLIDAAFLLVLSFRSKRLCCVLISYIRNESDEAHPRKGCRACFTLQGEDKRLNDDRQSIRVLVMERT